MLRAITWEQFIRFLLCTVVLYYVFVWLLFFRKQATRRPPKTGDGHSPFGELARAAEGEVPAGPAAIVNDTPEIRAVERQTEQDPNLYPMANELVESIDYFIVKAGKNQLVKEEVLFGIQQLIGQYPMLRLTAFTVAINNYIGVALKNNCAFGLDELEMASLWVSEKKT